MTKQAKLTDDCSTNPELNDPIAFSRYTEAIDRIIHQYLYKQSLTSDSEGKLVHF